MGERLTKARRAMLAALGDGWKHYDDWRLHARKDHARKDLPRFAGIFGAQRWFLVDHGLIEEGLDDRWRRTAAGRAALAKDGGGE